MPAPITSSPPAPFECETCQSDAYKAKAGPGCTACGAFAGTHYFPHGDGPEDCHVLFLGDVPQAPRVFVGAADLQREKRRPQHHLAFFDDAGKVVRNAVAHLQKAQPDFRDLRARYGYAVRCTADNPSKGVITACQTPLKHDLMRVVRAREVSSVRGPLVVVAHGTTAMRALGIAVQSANEMAGRIYETTFAEVPLVVVPTMSLKAIAAAPGKYSSVVADLERAFRAARNESIQVHDRAYLESVYRLPKSLAEVRALVDEVIAYADQGAAPEAWAISVDTETNTLHPHRDGLQLTVVSFAWAAGKSGAVALWHKDNTHYDPAEAFEEVKRLLACRKPKIMHNGKYDLKVFWKKGADVANYAWDVMLAEHVLEEDKKGQYSLKYLTKQFLPQYAGYEDQLHTILAKIEGESQAQSIEVKGTPVVQLPDDVREALDRLGLPLSFQAKALAKRADDIERRRDAPKRPPAEVLAAMERLGLPPPTSKIFKRALAKVRKTQDTLRDMPRLEGTDPAVADDVNLVLAQTDFTWEEPPTEAELAGVADMRRVVAAKAAGWFRAKLVDVAPAEGEEGTLPLPKKGKKDGGFENIPLDDLLFYAAVDADCTRQLAVQQKKRMLEEDRVLAEHRYHVELGLKYDVTAKFTVVKNCAHDHPAPVLLKEMYLPRARELAKIEYHGVRVDRAYLKRADRELEIATTSAVQKLHAMAGEAFNLQSGRKLANFLFDVGVGYVHPNPADLEERLRTNPELEKGVKIAGNRVMYRAVSYTEKGELQTTEAVLKTLQARYGCPFANLLLAYRKASKAKNTFLKNAEVLSRLDQFLHTNYNLAGTSTGRLSSNDLNMQNIPKGEVGGVKCKRLFVPEDDSMVFVNADAKGAEVSVFAAYAKDPGLIQALLEGRDTHCYFSGKVLDPNKIAGHLTGDAKRLALEKAGIDDEHAWSYDDFNNRAEFLKRGLGPHGVDAKGKEINDPTLWADPALVKYAKKLNKHRDNIKRVVFGILYGAGPKKIADIAGIDVGLAKTIIELLFAEFPSIPNFVEQTKWHLRTFGLVETYDGRRRRFAIKNAPKGLLAQAERQAVNFLVQGTNSDIVLKVLTALAPVVERDFGGRLLLTVHDSIGFQLPKRYVPQLRDLMTEYGTTRVAAACPWMPVPYRWDVEVGPSYGDLTGVETWLEKNPLPPPSDPDRFEGYVEEEMFDEFRRLHQESLRAGKPPANGGGV